MSPERRSLLIAGLAAPLLIGRAAAQVIDAREQGARGDGRALDHHAINAAIAALSKGGGGTLHLPAGRYLCFSIRLRSNVTLSLSPGAVIVAADPARDGGSYDAPEVNRDDFYQDFGHSHWHNSLIWAVDEHNIAIVGGGLIDGSRGLTRNGPGAKWQNGTGSAPNSMRGMAAADIARLEGSIDRMAGLGNKAIALRNCRGVLLRDVRLLAGGHFGVLATGVEALTIDNLLVDTNRDGLDIDACRNVHVANCTVNTPNDDAICLKSSLGLGIRKPAENVTITGCTVSGFDLGTVLDGSYGRTLEHAPDRDGPTGRIKLGTESSGGFRNVAISNCVFERSRGLALETVDGAALEDVVVSGLTMRDVTSAPIFLRLGDRHRTDAPPATLARLRRVTISNVIASVAEPRYAATVAGLPDAPVEAVTLSDIRLHYPGGGTAGDATRQVPEERAGYPEPSMFGVSPAYGLYVRHASGLRLDRIDISTEAPDARPALLFNDARGVSLTNTTGTGTPMLTGGSTLASADR